jgi:MFS transporter, FHS family, L-fucose permease
MRKNIIPILLIGLLFAVFGFAAWLNSILIPFFQISLELSALQTTLVTFSFFIAYVVMALPSSYLLRIVGFKSGLIYGLLIMMAGCLVFIPAAYTRSYPLFLCGLFFMGSGQALLQTAANPFITILGSIESAAQRNSFMGVCNKLAGIASQHLLAPILLLHADTIADQVKLLDAVQKNALLSDMILRVVNPYWIMAIVLVVIMVIIKITKLPNVEEEESANDDVSVPKKTIWLYPNLVLGVIALLCAEGLESITSYYIVPFAQGLGFSTSTSLGFIDFIIYAMLAGYLAGIIAIPRFISQQVALRICALLGIGCCIAAIMGSNEIAIGAFIIMGFCNALNWPCIWPLSLKGLGSFTKIASGMLVMAIAGDAVFPILYAQITSTWHAKSGIYLLLFFYLIIFLYGYVGHQKKQWKFHQ